jgi:hypothetical protein
MEDVKKDDRNERHKMRDHLRATNQTFVKVNGQEISVSEYYKDPQKYNSIPMADEFKQQIQEEHIAAVKTKELLRMDPSTIKSILG